MVFRFGKRRPQDEVLEERLLQLGKALREFREKAGLSVRKLAERLEVSPTIISRIERNEIKRWPSQDMLYKMAEALNGYADEFRLAVGIVPPETQEILTRSQGFATTLESIHDRFVRMLKAKGLTEEQIEEVMEQATEQTILDVVNGREPLGVEWDKGSSDPFAEHEDAGYQVLGLPPTAGIDNPDMTAMPEDGPSEYLARNRDVFLPPDLTDTFGQPGAGQTRAIRSPKRESIDAGDARIVVKRQISDQERTELEAIAKVIAQLLAK